ncbi:MAG: Gfo/Idh/MocA family oxidoreductase [Pirellulales bacterium]|jgi:predicted dehydrogenase|nr:Gfo/Idh/MocA family oxidoreductase [Thermoguttaceae bacterium]MDD4787189.1 Gfo/Idh/MocA family oxidoreductase [Pirellulales bacterium]MDI9442935.1 Gfo/Idh/MocA family oxidoreductase [Planctomycetota bacterium]NLY99218.1 Gfo/Idh/MocA family oxidoreductase [Pirellulaceae bacterium]
MSESKTGTSRREFLKNTSRIAAASALAGVAAPRLHAAEDNTLEVALVGCGGRGTGAAADALSVNQGPVKLVAMADIFEDRLSGSFKNLNDRFAAQLDVPEERRFVGFDAYKKAMDCLKPGGIAIFASPLTFRWVHFAHAVEKGLHVFMEKPLTADGPTSRRMIKLAEQADAKNLKAGVGLMSRHSRALGQLHDRIQDGEIGDIVTMRAYRMTGPIGSAFSTKWPGQPSELLWQLRRFHSFIWASGGCFNDFYIHVIDHCCWMKNAWPVKAQALGGRHYRHDPAGNLYIDQNFDSYSVEYTFADGTKLILDGRCVSGCAQFYSSYAHGTKGSAVVSKHGDCGAPSSTYNGQSPEKANMIWESQVPADQRNPYQNEWNDLVDAIRNDKPFNEVKRGVEASLVSSLGRKAAHTGQEITFDEMLNSEDEYAPGADTFAMDSPAPVRADADGKYPIPMPGIVTKTEY